MQEAIIAEVNDFPVDQLAVGKSNSVAMHVPVPELRANPRLPVSAAELAMGPLAAAANDAEGGDTSKSFGAGHELMMLPEVRRCRLNTPA